MSLSARARQSVLARESADDAMLLLTIHDAAEDGPIRLVDSLTNVISRGETYQRFPLVGVLPTDDPDQWPDIRLIVDNIGRDLIDMIMSIEGQPEVTLEVALRSQPDIIEDSWRLRWISSEWNASQLTVTLGPEAMLAEPFPALIFDPAGFPGLHD